MPSIRKYGSLYLILSYFLEISKKVKYPPLVLNLVTSTLSPQRCMLRHLSDCTIMLSTAASFTKGNSPNSLFGPRIDSKNHCASLRLMRDKI